MGLLVNADSSFSLNIPHRNKPSGRTMSQNIPVIICRPFPRNCPCFGTVISALDIVFRSCGWNFVMECVDRLEFTCAKVTIGEDPTTITGGDI